MPIEIINLSGIWVEVKPQLEHVIRQKAYDEHCNYKNVSIFNRVYQICIIKL